MKKRIIVFGVVFMLIASVVMFVYINLPNPSHGSQGHSSSIEESGKSGLFVKELKWRVDCDDSIKYDIIKPEEVFLEKYYSFDELLINDDKKIINNGVYNLNIFRDWSADLQGIDHLEQYKYLIKYILLDSTFYYPQGNTLSYPNIILVESDLKLLDDSLSYLIKKDTSTIGKLLVWVE